MRIEYFRLKGHHKYRCHRQISRYGIQRQAAKIQKRDRQRKYKFRTDPGSRDDVDLFLVILDDVTNDRQTEAGTFFVFSARGVGLVKTGPDLVDVFLFDADTVILDRNEDFSRGRTGGKFNAAVLTGKAFDMSFQTA